MNGKENQKSRRAFLLGLGAAAGGAVAVSAVRQAAPGESVKAEPEAKRGYQLTEHVKTYYRTTRV